MYNTNPIWMSDKRYDMINERIRASYPNACILYIDEVINEEIQRGYNRQKEEILKRNGSVNELQLFHGTKEEIIPLIAYNGFDPTKNVRGAYGYGVYFAKNASYSSGYMTAKASNQPTYMFLADVLIGKCITGGNQNNAGKMYDNNVDNVGAPSIYTTVYHDGAYPRYIIAFHKEAR
jgi:hypothetical protein